jgi:UDP-2,3-diacylglucosamine hydrolase
LTTLFVSDLHLAPDRPAITRLFMDFLAETATEADALYILGDLFEAWIGDDDDAPLGRQVAEGLRELVDKGVGVGFIHGNRDFLVGEQFAASSGITLLPENQVIDLYGTSTLIMHGDTLCTDDIPYQALRAQVRAPAWQARVLALPLAQRRELARNYRRDSQQALREAGEDIMDVNPQAVTAALRQHGVNRLIHGHTHRPAIHELSVDGAPANRIVLGDWYDAGSVLCCDGNGCHLKSLTLPVGKVHEDDHPR